MVPSFWVYFRHNNHQFPPQDVGDIWSQNSIWQDWINRPVPYGTGLPGKEIPEDSPALFIRTRYSRTFSIVVPHGQCAKSVELDLNEYKKSRGVLGRAPEWVGSIDVFVKKMENGHLEVKVSLVNNYRAKLRESAWFDVRMQINVDGKLLDTFCPLLNVRVPAQTVNCVLANETHDTALNRIILEQINLAIHHQQVMLPAISFEEATWVEVEAKVREFAAVATDTHAARLRKAVDQISANRTAVLAMNIVLETYRRAMRVRVPDGSAK